MKTPNFLIYLAVCAGVTYLIRMLPLVLVKKKITNRYALSFLHYIPYAVLGVMTVPACFFATGNIITAFIGFIVGCILAYFNKSLLTVAAGASLSILIADIIITYLL